MPCLYCNANFSILKWKKKCDHCTHHFCTTCIIRKRCLACASVLNCQWKHDSLMNVKIKDLKLYLTVRGTPVHLYTEKNELVQLVILGNQPTNVNSSENPVIRSATASGSPNQGRDLQQNRNTFEPNAQQNSTPNPEAEEASHNSGFGFNSGDTGQPPNLQASSHNESSVKRPIPTGLANKIIIADITSTDQIVLLSSRELKQILFDNFIDYKGCVEKNELQDRVRSLYNDKIKSEVDSDDSNMCKICWDEPIDCVLLDCGHMTTCTACGKRLNECPICRQFIVKCVHVFRS